MKPFVCIFAAAVLAGLGAFFLFDGLKAFALSGNIVMVNVVWFVAFITALTVGSAALGVLLQRAVAKADYHMVSKLEHRIRALEQGPPRRAAKQPAPPPPASASASS